MMPSHILSGYQYKPRGIAVYSSRVMNDEISGEYILHRGNQNKVEFRMNQEQMDYIRRENYINRGSLILMRVDKLEDNIHLFLEKIDD
jgi:hypothetical protein